MNTRDYIKTQSINFCYMSFLLEAVGQKSVWMNGQYIKDVMMDSDDTILAVTSKFAFFSELSYALIGFV